MTTAPPLVLLVEDFDDAREMYADYLEFNGFRVAGAADAVGVSRWRRSSSRRSS